MKTKQLLPLLLLAILYLGCKNEGENTESETPATETPAQEAGKDSLHLNQGAKWEVNAEMKPYILASEQAFIDYKSNKRVDYKALAGVLKEKTDTLISSCTMKGESHEQLHLWLLPHLTLIKELAAAPSQSEADVVIGKLETSFALFHTYFQ